MKTQKEGICPKCQNDKISYGETIQDGDSIGYKFICDDCGCEGVEWYTLSFVEQVIKEGELR